MENLNEKPRVVSTSEGNQEKLISQPESHVIEDPFVEGINLFQLKDEGKLSRSQDLELQENFPDDAFSNKDLTDKISSAAGSHELPSEVHKEPDVTEGPTEFLESDTDTNSPPDSYDYVSANYFDDQEPSAEIQDPQTALSEKLKFTLRGKLFENEGEMVRDRDSEVQQRFTEGDLSTRLSKASRVR